MDRDILLAILQSDLALSGLLLVFAGFLVSKSDSYNTRRGDRYRYAALASGVPIFTAIISAWACVDALGNWHWWGSSLWFFKAVLALTAAYIIASGWMLRP